MGAVPGEGEGIAIGTRQTGGGVQRQGPVAWMIARARFRQDI